MPSWADSTAPMMSLIAPVKLPRRAPKELRVQQVFVEQRAIEGRKRSLSRCE